MNEKEKLLHKLCQFRPKSDHQATQSFSPLFTTSGVRLLESDGIAEASRSRERRRSFVLKTRDTLHENVTHVRALRPPQESARLADIVTSTASPRAASVGCLSPCLHILAFQATSGHTIIHAPARSQLDRSRWQPSSETTRLNLRLGHVVDLRVELHHCGGGVPAQEYSLLPASCDVFRGGRSARVTETGRALTRETPRNSDS